MTAPREPATLTPEDARAEIVTLISLARLNRAGKPPGTQLDIDAILATVDALAALVDWPKLLEAGERAGKLDRGSWRAVLNKDGVWRGRNSWRLTEPS